MRTDEDMLVSPELLQDPLQVFREQQSRDGDAQSARHRLRIRTTERGQEAAGRVLTETTEEESAGG